MLAIDLLPVFSLNKGSSLYPASVRVLGSGLLPDRVILAARDAIPV